MEGAGNKRLRVALTSFVSLINLFDLQRTCFFFNLCLAYSSFMRSTETIKGLYSIVVKTTRVEPLMLHLAPRVGRALLRVGQHTCSITLFSSMTQDNVRSKEMFASNLSDL